MKPRTYRDRLEWDMGGKCRYRVLKSKKCTEKDGHYKSYTDEYGSWQHCHKCRGNETIYWPVWIRVPAFDAPRPSEDWEPDWIES